ncbi:hypothetical protein LOAG_03138, partial [Loa loa]
MKSELDIIPIVTKTLKVMQQMRSGKAIRIDGISSEIRKHGSQALHAKFYELIPRYWEKSKLLPDLHDAIIIVPCKNKG